jgi:hypothetical protein
MGEDALNQMHDENSINKGRSSVKLTRRVLIEKHSINVLLKALLVIYKTPIQTNEDYRQFRNYYKTIEPFLSGEVLQVVSSWDFDLYLVFDDGSEDI